MSSKGTSIGELYSTIGAIVLTSTGRNWWKKAGMKASPAYPYCLIQLTEGQGIENEVVEIIEFDEALENGEWFQERPWGTQLIKVAVEFFKDGTDSNDKAIGAATRFKLALRLEERMWDLWQICGLVGGLDLIDLSATFRQDTEGRALVKFNIYANIALPLPLDETNIFDIDTQTINVVHVRVDGEETEIEVEVENTEN